MDEVGAVMLRLRSVICESQSCTVSKANDILNNSRAMKLEFLEVGTDRQIIVGWNYVRRKTVLICCRIGTIGRHLGRVGLGSVGVRRDPIYSANAAGYRGGVFLIVLHGHANGAPARTSDRGSHGFQLRSYCDLQNLRRDQ